MSAPDDKQLERELAALPQVRASQRFERELRERFVAGDFPAEAPARRSRPWLGPVLAALAAGLLLSLFVLQRRAPASAPAAWRVLQAHSGASVFLNDRPMAVGDSSAFARGLVAGTLLRTPTDSGLVLVLDQRFALSIGPDSEVVLPNLAEDPAAPYLIDARAGHVACSTGPAFSGAHLVVRTPQAEVEVVGTRFAVDVYPEGTCVCCSHGEVAVRGLLAAAARASVPAQGMAFVFGNGELATGAVMQDHLAPLTALEGLW